MTAALDSQEKQDPGVLLAHEAVQVLLGLQDHQDREDRKAHQVPMELVELMAIMEHLDVMVSLEHKEHL